MNKLLNLILEEISNMSIGFIDTNQTLPSVSEELIVKPDIPNTMSFYHGGNLDRYDPSLTQKTGRYEYGAGLYLTTHYQTAAKYAKGSRRMYLITVEKGIDINKAFINLDKAKEFINTYAIRSMRKELIKLLDSYTKDTTIKAYIFNNILNNHKAIKPSNTNNVRDFFIENNIDYEIVDNAFGWGEEMMVLYNMKKIVKATIIKPTDKIQDYMIKN
jgi:hypothetical protein